MAVDDVSQREEPNAEHRMDIEPTHYTSTGARYRVTYLGETLIQSARDPAFEACRALLAKGVKGRLVTYSPGSSVPRMRVDIEKGCETDDHRQQHSWPSVRPIQAAPDLQSRRRRGKGVSRPTVSSRALVPRLDLPG